GSRVATTLKVLGVQLTVMGETLSADPGCEVVSHLDPARGVYRKLVIRNNRLEGAIVLGEPDPGGRFQRLFKSGEELPCPALELLEGTSARDALLEGGADLEAMPDDTQICNCNTVSKGTILAAIQGGAATVDAVGQACKAGTGCGTCQPL